MIPEVSVVPISPKMGLKWRKFELVYVDLILIIQLGTIRKELDESYPIIAFWASLKLPQGRCEPLRTKAICSLEGLHPLRYSFWVICGKLLYSLPYIHGGIDWSCNILQIREMINL